MHKEDDKQVLDWLTPVDYGLQQDVYFKKRQSGTGQWLLDTPEFQHWMSNTKRTLVCRGIPGAGKTILTSIVIHHLDTTFKNDSKVGIAYIYCEHKQQKDQDVESLLASLLKQLLAGQSCLPESTANELKQHKEGRTRPSRDELITNLESAIKLYSMVFFIIDAMDECQKPSLEQLLSILFDLQKAYDIRIFATSRPMSEKLSEFLAGNNSSLLDVRASQSDVLAFLEGQMNLLPNIVKSNSRLQEDIKTGIAEAVDGM